MAENWEGKWQPVIDAVCRDSCERTIVRVLVP
jgi:hypothetical protein